MKNLILSILFAASSIISTAQIVNFYPVDLKVIQTESLSNAATVQFQGSYSLRGTSVYEMEVYKFFQLSTTESFSEFSMKDLNNVFVFKLDNALTPNAEGIIRVFIGYTTGLEPGITYYYRSDIYTVSRSGPKTYYCSEPNKLSFTAPKQLSKSIDTCNFFRKQA